MKYITFILWITILFLPTLGQAQTVRLGTDDYLRQVIGLTETELKQKFATEEREKFAAVKGPGQITDPAGDVLDRVGQTAEISVPWADLLGASLSKDEKKQLWILQLTTAAPIPNQPSMQVQFFAFLEGDGLTDNNDPDGIRADMDREYSIKYDAAVGWYLDYRWYNREPDFWAVDKKTVGHFTISGDKVFFEIPFSEIGSEVIPDWRTAAAVQSGMAMQIDAAPTIGFPPPLGTQIATSIIADANLNGFIAAGIGMATLIITYGLWSLYRKQD